MNATPSYTLVTVAHRGDYGLMHLQARSLAKYLDTALAESIMVIENPAPGEPTDWRGTLSREYGGLAAKVRFVEAREVSDIPTKVSGWFSQQILKLMVSAVVATDRYIVLDGKNHLVHRLGRDFVETPTGKLRSYLMSYQAHPMKAFLEDTLGYFGLDPGEHLHAFLPTTTPFALPTDLVRELVRRVEDRERRGFPDAFLYDGYKRSEFFLFGAYLLSLGKAFTDVFDLSATRSPAVWPESTAPESLAAIAYSEECATPFFAVHRRAFPRLDRGTRDQIAAFWCRRGLFSSIDAALEFLSNPQRVQLPT